MTATVLVGRERRRWWTTAQKLLMVEESFTPGASVAAVARRHEVHPNQLHGWRRDVLSGKLSRAGVRLVEITSRDQGCTVARGGGRPQPILCPGRRRGLRRLRSR